MLPAALRLDVFESMNDNKDVKHRRLALQKLLADQLHREFLSQIESAIEQYDRALQNHDDKSALIRSFALHAVEAWGHFAEMLGSSFRNNLGQRMLNVSAQQQLLTPLSDPPLSLDLAFSSLSLKNEATNSSPL